MTRTLTDLQRLEAVARYQGGESMRRIADRFGVAYSTINAVIPNALTRPSGWGTDRPDVADAEVRRLRDDEGLSWPALGARVGMTASGARRRYLAACRRDSNTA